MNKIKVSESVSKISDYIQTGASKNVICQISGHQDMPEIEKVMKAQMGGLKIPMTKVSPCGRYLIGGVSVRFIPESTMGLKNFEGWEAPPMV